VGRLFHGHSFEIGNKFRLSASNESPQSLSAQFIELDEEEWSRTSPPTIEQETLFGTAGLALTWAGKKTAPETASFPLSERGGLSLETVRRRTLRRDEERASVAFVTTSSLTPDEVVYLLGKVLLNPEEDLLTRALRIIEPDIDRIAAIPAAGLPSARYYQPGGSSRGGVVVKIKGQEKRLPIGTMGDGIWRLLALALSLIRAEGGVLLVDEIDTGLHYSVMEDMWRLVYRTARRLNVQVFATTHSSDCWHALAHVCNEKDLFRDNDVSIQHIEKGEKLARSFSEQEMMIAADRGFEVR
jgi:hypothetical protein